MLLKSLGAFALRSLIAAALIVALPASTAAAGQRYAPRYDQLVQLFQEWRAFERADRREGVPDYTAATMARKQRQLKAYQTLLEAFDVSDWSTSRKIDHQLVRAEMNGMDFNLRVLRPWERDPAFYQSVWTYQSDTPSHEGPGQHDAVIDLWAYSAPLDANAEAKLARELGTIPPMLSQARINLTGNARDLWLAGIGTMEDQTEALARVREQAKSPALIDAAGRALTATRSFTAWLEQQAPSKTGPSGIGKDHYSWYLRNVHLVPLSWEQEVAILTRELYRAHAQLRLEEHRNKALPPLSSAADAGEYRRRAAASVRKYMAFLRDRDIITVRDYMEPALMQRLGDYVVPDQQNFFALATHREMMTLLTHFYHWWDIEMMASNPHPSPIRKEPLLYNIWDSRSEGMATAMEEMMLHAGLYDDNPRVREIVWTMLAQRAARGLGSLYAHANMMTMKEASDYQVRWTPNGWMSPTLDLLGIEQQLYLRQPGYGSSYVSGKHQIEKLLAEYADQKGADFTLKEFLDTMNRSGLIPVSLIRWEMTSYEVEMEAPTDR